MSEGLILMAVGMGVVFATLSLLLGAIVLLPCVLSWFSPAADESCGEDVPDESSQPQPAEHIDGQLIAILTAAATAALGARVRVFRVGFFREEVSHEHGWVQQARSELHTSHRRKNY